jgi:hypothetical protein
MGAVHRWLMLGFVGATGCWQGGLLDQRDKVNVKNEPVQFPKDLPAAPTESASRVYAVGQTILVKNPQLGLRPLFTAIGSPEETIFHSGFSHIYISEGLIQKCKTDSELAGVLCLELGKMVSEREAQIVLQNRDDEREPLFPPRLPDVVGGGMSADMTSQAELARYQKEYPKKRVGNPTPPPDSKELAARYYTNAGYVAADLTKIEPLLRTAERNPKFEKQLNLGPQDSGLGIPVPKKTR